MNDVSSDPLPRLAPRRADSHKGDFGRVLVLGGSRGMSGAPSLTAVAALRSGAGLVTVATPDSVQATVAALNPCYTTIPLIEDDYGIADMANVMDLLAARGQFDAWAVGPGLGRTEGVAEMVAQLYREIPRPMVGCPSGSVVGSGWRACRWAKAIPRRRRSIVATRTCVTRAPI